MSGRTDVRNIFDLQTENDYEDDQYNRPINPTGLFSAGGFGQRIFFRQNTAILSQMEVLGDHQAPGGFISEQDSKLSDFLRQINQNLGRGNAPDDVDSDDSIESSDGEDEIDPLETFLAALNLTEYYPLFKKERMDLDGKIYSTVPNLITFSANGRHRSRFTPNWSWQRTAYKNFTLHGHQAS